MKIIKHRLDFNKTYPFFIDHIKCDKTLSQEVVKRIDFKQGDFFTILPKNAVISRLYKFSEGGIIPLLVLEGETRFNLSGVAFTPREIRSTDDDLVGFTIKYLKTNSKRFLFVDSYNESPNDSHMGIENTKPLFYKSEVHYVLDQDNSANEIKNAIYKSDVIWHSLILLVEKFDEFPSYFDDDIFSQICSKIKYVILGAYDGESYIIWQKR